MKECTPPMSWYEPRAEEPEEWFHISEYQVHYAQEYLMDLIDAVYKTGSIEDIERCIDELSSCLKVTYEISDPLIQKKDANSLMASYLDYQKVFLNLQKEQNKEMNNEIQ